MLYEWLDSLLRLLPSWIVFLEFEAGFTIFKFEMECCVFDLYGLCQTIVRRFVVLYDVN